MLLASKCAALRGIWQFTRSHDAHWPTPESLIAAISFRNMSGLRCRRELQSKLVDYPIDNETGFRLSSNCSFLCPHRHFSHLLQVYDLENSAVGVDPSLDAVIYNSIDNFYRVSCNESNWFNEECRGFTQCGLASMNAVSGRRHAAAGNLTNLVDTVITPNGM